MSYEPWEPVITQRLGFWERQFALVPTRAQDRFDAIFGVIVPVLCFMTDPIVFQSRIGEYAAAIQLIFVSNFAAFRRV